MSNKVKDKAVKLKKDTKAPKVSTTEALNSFMNFTMQNFRVLDNNDKIFENRINYILSSLAGDRTIDEDEVGDDAVFVSHYFVEKDKQLHKIKFLIEGYQLQPITPNEDGTMPESDPNRFVFKKEDIVVEVMAPSLEEAVEELKTRIRASKSIEIVKA